MRVSRLLTGLSRRLGFEVVAYPGGKLHWRRLVDMLSAWGVDVILDVGANVGQYATSMRHAGYRGRIVSFEPLREAHRRIRALARNDPAWEIAPRLAVGASAGRVTVLVCAESEMSSLLPFTEEMGEQLASSPVIGTEMVDQVSLDQIWSDYVGEEERAFVKLDVQGTEHLILDGAGQCAGAMCGIQIELSLVPIYEGETHYLHMMERIESLGFEPHYIVPGYFSRHARRMLQFDAIFLRPPS